MNPPGAKDTLNRKKLHCRGWYITMFGIFQWKYFPIAIIWGMRTRRQHQRQDRIPSSSKTTDGTGDGDWRASSSTPTTATTNAYCWHQTWGWAIYGRQGALHLIPFFYFFHFFVLLSPFSVTTSLFFPLLSNSKLQIQSLIFIVIYYLSTKWQKHTTFKFLMYFYRTL